MRTVTLLIKQKVDICGTFCYTRSPWYLGWIIVLCITWLGVSYCLWTCCKWHALWMCCAARKNKFPVLIEDEEELQKRKADEEARKASKARRAAKLKAGAAASNGAPTTVGNGAGVAARPRLTEADETAQAHSDIEEALQDMVDAKNVDHMLGKRVEKLTKKPATDDEAERWATDDEVDTGDEEEKKKKSDEMQAAIKVRISTTVAQGGSAGKVCENPVPRWAPGEKHECGNLTTQVREFHNDDKSNEISLPKSSFAEEHAEEAKQHLLDKVFENFAEMHNGLGHLEKTEQWLSKRPVDGSGKIRPFKLKGTLDNANFGRDLMGVWRLAPRDAYIASKMLIEACDFQGIFDEADGFKGKCCKIRGRAAPKAATNKITAAKEKATDAAKATAVKAKAAAKKAQHPIHGEQPDNSSVTVANRKSVMVAPHTLGTGQYTQYILRNCNVSPFIYKKWGRVARKNYELFDDPEDVVYVFTCSANGIVRFHLPSDSAMRKLWQAFGDSENQQFNNLTENIKHAGTYGCFCFGIGYREEERYYTPPGAKEPEPGGGTILTGIRDGDFGFISQGV